MDSEASDQGQNRHLGVLPPGHLVAEFRIERVLGQGGFGIVYLAFDTRLERLVALKEFMPRSLAQRRGNGCVEPLSERHRKTFELGLRSFIREARSVAQFKNPALVEVYRFWEALGTAYMVMPFYEGQTLQQRLEGLTAPPPEPWLRELLERVLKGLDVVHQLGWLHRDIAPDNILLLPGDQPLLLDFGSAKQDIGHATQALAGLLKPGFAPFEQYGDSASLKQGPWTDLYALGAMLYYAISGKVPVASVERVNHDAMPSALVLGRRRYSAALLQFIDHCLAVWPEQRPRNVTAALELLRRLDAQEKLRNQGSSGRRPQDAGVPRRSSGDRHRVGLPARWPSWSWAGSIAALLLTLGGLAAWEPWSRPAVQVADESAAIPVHSVRSGSPPSEDPPSTPVAAEPDTAALPLAAAQALGLLPATAQAPEAPPAAAQSPALPLAAVPAPEGPLSAPRARLASPAKAKQALSQPPLNNTRVFSASRTRQAAARKAECESLAHLLSLDGNSLAQRRFAQLGCRR